MKFEIELDLKDFDYFEFGGGYGNNIKDISDVVFDRLTDKILCNLNYGNGDTYKDKIDNIINKIEKDVSNKFSNEFMSSNFSEIKSEITESLKNDIENKYKKTQVFRQLKNDIGIENDSNIKSDLRKYFEEMIRDIVRSEIRKMIKV